MFDISRGKLARELSQLAVEVNRSPHARFDVAVHLFSFLRVLDQCRFKVRDIEAHASPLEDSSAERID